ncbi:MAG: DUF2071 domain-containing protein [Chitinophagaceae bacterium]
MGSTKIFLTAAWKNLIMANYEIEPTILEPYLPAFTELDYYNGKCYVSLVAFMFEEVKLKGFSIPFHTRFPEVNLRFYVKHIAEDGSVQRGVVFISEIVPKAAIAWVANNIYNEKYVSTSMEHAIAITGQDLLLDYSWRWKGKDNLISTRVTNELWPIEPDTAEAFIFEHYYGYAKVSEVVTNQYAVEHPVWNTYPVHAYKIDCQFEDFYGAAFAFLDNATPASVFVAQGSEVVVRTKTVLRAG